MKTVPKCALSNNTLSLKKKKQISNQLHFIYLLFNPIHFTSLDQ